LIAFLFSCQEFDSDIPSLTNEEEEEDNHYVSVDRAILIASIIEFPLPQEKKHNVTNANRSNFNIGSLESREIKESKSPIGKGNKAFYHIINYKEGGFVIISGDDRLSPILAFLTKIQCPSLKKTNILKVYWIGTPPKKNWWKF
jgi:hypothetical protein